MIGGLITISLIDQKKTITMNTKNKTYFERVSRIRSPRSRIQGRSLIKKRSGPRLLTGHPCIKYDAVYYLKDKPQEKFNTVLWEARDLGGLPIRTEMVVPESKKMGGPERWSRNLRNQIRATTAAMFDVPKDFKKVGSMNEVMGMGQQGDMKEMMKQMQKMKTPKGE